MADVTFLLTMAVAVGGAVFALEAKELVYGAMGLAGSLFGVASLFFLLDAPYVAVFQIAVYIGAVAVLILFTVMLVRQERWAKELPATSGARVSGIITGGAIAVGIAFAAAIDGLSGTDFIANTKTFVDIGTLISTTYAPVLEVLAFVLAASVIGALTLSRADREEGQQ
jgi:NADH:ubiquinone oxidoreductase subunit 6 (subunit J)